jgi:HD-GYP domain-containing protein (c-di-GMP phosphodiesterase class II)
MRKEIVELPVEQLRLGVYVSRLDRPWEDTPFLFQGFAVGSDDELETLRRLCKSVYVEVSVDEAAELRAAKAAKAVKRPGAPAQENLLEQLAARPGALVDRVPPKDAIELKSELTLATKTFTEAKRAVGNIFNHLRRGGGVDAPNLQNVVGSMVDSVFRNRDAMSWLARMKSKDDYLYSHSLSASVWALAFGRHLGLDKDTLTCVGTGAMLLDIGKTSLPSELLKKSGKPSEQEWKLIYSHVERGVQLLRTDPKIDTRILSMVATHHERVNGSGYPNKLEGEQVPLLGRIAGIVDCYDAMVSERQYAKPRSTYDAVRELKRMGGVEFPAELVELFIQAVGVFPTGTLVELNTGEVGVVIGQNRYRRLRPQVMLILDAQKKPREEFTTIDLLTVEGNSDKDKPNLWITQGLERGAYGIDASEYFL